MARLRSFLLAGGLVAAQSFSGARRLSEDAADGARGTPWAAFVDDWISACRHDECRAQTAAPSALKAMQLLHKAEPSSFYSDMETKLDSQGMSNTTVVVGDPKHGCPMSPETLCPPAPTWLAGLCSGIPGCPVSRTPAEGRLIIELYPFLGQSTVRSCSLESDSIRNANASSEHFLLPSSWQVALTAGGRHLVLAIDTWKGDHGVQGIFTWPRVYRPESAISAGSDDGVPEMYWQFIRIAPCHTSPAQTPAPCSTDSAHARTRHTIPPTWPSLAPRQSQPSTRRQHSIGMEGRPSRGAGRAITAHGRHIREGGRARPSELATRCHLRQSASRPRLCRRPDGCL